jgi:small subunit ribosomal protein S11
MVQTKKKKTKKHIPLGKVYISASFNNTVITFTDPSGNVCAWSSSGSRGFKGSRRGTPYAAQIASDDAAKKALALGMRSCAIYVSGPGSGRDSAIRAIANAGLAVSAITDVTPLPYNGCRPPKRRRA